MRFSYDCLVTTNRWHYEWTSNSMFKLKDFHRENWGKEDPKKLKKKLGIWRNRRGKEKNIDKAWKKDLVVELKFSSKVSRMTKNDKQSLRQRKKIYKREREREEWRRKEGKTNHLNILLLYSFRMAKKKKVICTKN